MDKIGLATVIYTDIAKDGGLEGTNLKAYESLQKDYSFQVVASGGVTYMEELQELKKMGLYGVILGKAIYAGSLILKEVVNHFEQETNSI